MFSFYTPFSGSTLQTYHLLFLAAILTAAGVSLYHHRSLRPALADVYLSVLVGAVAGARAVHALLNASYFASDPTEILRLNAGGLNWHGAVIGGLVGVALGAHWHGIRISLALADLSFALPLLSLAGWWGCLEANCGYGVEVDTLARYPALIVAEMPDVYGLPAPRFNTQLLGIVLSILLLLLALLLRWRSGAAEGHFWYMLALLSLSMFAIGFLRADYAPVIGGLRADQWLDLGLLSVALRQGWLHRGKVETNDRI